MSGRVLFLSLDKTEVEGCVKEENSSDGIKDSLKVNTKTKNLGKEIKLNH